MKKLLKRLLTALLLAILFPFIVLFGVILVGVIFCVLALLPILALICPSVIIVTVNGRKTNLKELFDL